MEFLKNLKRYPLNGPKELRAWDAADELILSKKEELILNHPLIINDNFGALCVGLQEFSPLCYTDSYVSYSSIQKNSNNSAKVISELDQLPCDFQTVILRLPKNLSFFEDILIRLSQKMKVNTKVVCASMVKHISKGHFDLLNKYIGETTTSLAQKKARLIYADFNGVIHKNKYPLKVSIEQWKVPLTNHSNLFSREKLDIGTRFFLENIPKGDFENILDLGCANGIIGLKAKQLNPSSSITFIDESAMAIKSAKENYSNQFDDSADFVWTNCLEGNEHKKFDLILCNPPFHQGTTVGDFIAIQMFKESHQALKPGGKLRIIGNRHLGYHVKLNKIFGNYTIVNQNKKFVIIDALR
ncbi:methyltransferase [Halobacteriovorax sp. HLS]|uniref:methyltransferase n=1 Tax=Halobacteriovorax sp. HLS TaxID=2234000 RepID=UPI0013E33FE0|nr:methyltransferase [Halobacteriovorax sp. HLS]